MKKLLILVMTLVLMFSMVTISFAKVSVKGYFRKDGTYVQPYVRTNPDGNPYNNYSYPGNYNPNTGEITGGNPDTYLKNYYNNNGSAGSYGASYEQKSIKDKSDFTIWNNNKEITNNNWGNNNPCKFYGYPFVIYLNTSCSTSNIHDWYIWNEDIGWVWFSSDAYTKCDIWKEGATIKLVLNHDNSNYSIRNIDNLRIPDFSITKIDNSYAKLECQTADFDSYYWCIWSDKTNSWTLFGCENPTTYIYSSNSCYKLIVNNQPERYKIHTLYSGRTID